MKMLLLAAITFIGLAAPVTAQEPYLWVRFDGQRSATNPALLLEFHLAKRDCAYGAEFVSEMIVRCMRMRGYRWAPTRAVVRARS